MRIHLRTRLPSRGGFLLIAVLVVVMLAAMVALSLIFRVGAEQASFAASVGSEQAWHAAMSGIQKAMHLASVAPKNPSAWKNNPGAFQHQLVLDDGSDKWYFSVYSHAAAEESQPRFGLSDESSKMNLNRASAEMLAKCVILPASSLQHLAPEPPAGTNSLSIDALVFETPVRPHLATLDDLLSVPGITSGMIYGEDFNRNYRLDPNEDDGALQAPPDDSDGQLFLGLQETATVFSYEYDRADDGSPRLQLNTPRESVPEFILPEKTAAFIQLAWENQRVFQTPAELLEAKEKFKDPEGKEVEVESGVGPKELPVIMDQLTTTFAPRLIGLVNINTASPKVLQALPGISPEKAMQIESTRQSLAPETLQSVAWLYQERLVNAAEFKALAPWITTRSHQFRFNVVGYGVPSGRYRVFEVVIDTADKQPQIIYLRDITKVGMPFPVPAEDETTLMVPESQS